MSSNQNIFQEQ